MRQVAKTIIDAVKVDYLKSRENIASDSELSRLSGVSPNTLTSVLRKGKAFDNRTLDRLAGALKCNPIDLLTVADVPEPFSPALAVGSS